MQCQWHWIAIGSKLLPAGIIQLPGRCVCFPAQLNLLFQLGHPAPQVMPIKCREYQRLVDPGRKLHPEIEVAPGSPQHVRDIVMLWPAGLLPKLVACVQADGAQEWQVKCCWRVERLLATVGRCWLN